MKQSVPRLRRVKMKGGADVTVIRNSGYDEWAMDVARNLIDLVRGVAESVAYAAYNQKTDTHYTNFTGFTKDLLPAVCDLRLNLERNRINDD